MAVPRARQRRAWLAGLVLVAVLVPLATAVARPSPKSVLLLNSYRWGTYWTDHQVDGFLAAFQEADMRASVFIDQLDRLASSSEFDDQFYSEYLLWRFGHRKFDLIAVTDDAALSFVIQHYADLFFGTPVVFSDVHTLDVTHLPPGLAITGVLEHQDYRETVTVARQLRPNAEQIVVFGNRFDNGSGPRRAQRFFETLSLDIPVTFHIDLDIEELTTVAAKIPAHDIIFVLANAQDAQGGRYDYMSVRKAVAEIAPAANFNFWDSGISENITVGGRVSQPHTQGQIVGAIATRILMGELAEQIPIQTAPSRYVFSYPALLRYDINLSDLPDSSVLINKPYSALEEFRSVILLALLVFSFLLVLILVLSINIQRRRKAEIALSQARDRLEDDVKARTSELEDVNQALTSSLTELEVTQKQLVESAKMAALGEMVAGVAHEINTPLGVSLTAASHLAECTKTILSAYHEDTLNQLQFEAFLSSTDETSGMLALNLERAVQLVQSFKQVAADQAVEVVRPIRLSDYLQTTVQNLGSELRAGHHTVEIACAEDLVLETQPGVIAQIITNLLLNSVRHGFGSERRGGTISIRVTQQEGVVRLAVRDDGIGMSEAVRQRVFEPFFTTARGRGGTGLGLSIVYNLVTHKLGGRIACESAPGQGAVFIVTVPQPAMTADAEGSSSGGVEIGAQPASG